MKRFLLFVSLLFFISLSHAQQIKILTTQTKISLRGLSIVNDNIIWASGSNGQVAKSIDGGKHFDWITVKGYEKRDFRDVEAFDANTALIMAVDTPAIILKTKDGSKTWKEVFYDDRKGMFLDAMDFMYDGRGIVFGDPINNKLFTATTRNYGDKWDETPSDNVYNADSAEALFAASGSNVKVIGNKYAPSLSIVTGGYHTRLFFNGVSFNLNIIHGTESQGANSVTVDSSVSQIVIVGGDFSAPNSSEKNIEVFAVYKNKPHALSVQTPPHGYRSCVSFINQNKLITCGLTGVDISNDGGLNWKLISDESFNVCAKAKKGNAVFLAGKDGRIAKLEN